MRVAKFMLAMLLLFAGTALAGDLVVVANPKSGVERLSREEVIFVFMGRWRHLPSGVEAVPVDAPAESAERAEFYRLLVDKDLHDIKAYWARLVYSGEGHPPLRTRSPEEVLKILATTPGALGYMERSQAKGRVKVVYEFGASSQ